MMTGQLAFVFSAFVVLVQPGAFCIWTSVRGSVREYRVCGFLAASCMSERYRKRVCVFMHFSRFSLV